MFTRPPEPIDYFPSNQNLPVAPYKTRSASERMYSRNCWGSPAAWAACAFSWMRSGREVVGRAELTQRSEMTQASRAWAQVLRP